MVPAFNAAATLDRTWNDLPHDLTEEATLVVDASTDARLLPFLIGFIDTDGSDIVSGGRTRSRAEDRPRGMPRWRLAANRLLTFTENCVTELNLGD